MTLAGPPLPPATRTPERLLLVSWSSFERAYATVGDLMARDVVADALRAAGWTVDVANEPYAGPGVDWTQVDPADYGTVVWVCGPFGDRPRVHALHERFAHARWHAVGVTLLPGAPRLDWVVARDHADGRPGRPDLAFAAPAPEPTPVVGVFAAPVQGEYARRSAAEDVGEAMRAAADRAGAVVLELETDCRPLRPTMRRTPGGVEALVGRCDAVLTSRLHGLVLALRAGVPAVAVDPVRGRGKLSAQARAVGWPALLAHDTDPDDVDGWLGWALREPGARAAADAAAARGRAGAQALAAEAAAAALTPAGTR